MTAQHSIHLVREGKAIRDASIRRRLRPRKGQVTATKRESISHLQHAVGALVRKTDLRRWDTMRESAVLSRTETLEME